MAKRVQRRRGTTTEHGSFTGAVGEITVDTTKDTIAVHDGSQAGGFPLAREDMNNVTNRIGITQLNCSDGSNGQFLKTNGSGTLSFATVDATSAAVGGDLSGTVGNAQLVANSVGNTEIANGAINTVKVENGSITTSKLDSNSVTTVKINDGAVTTAKIVNSAITSTQILDGTIVAGDLASNAVTSIKILDGNVTGSKLADGAVSGGKIANTTITADKMVGQTRGKILYANVNGSIAWLSPGAAGTVLKSDGTDIAYGSIATADIAAGAVTSTKIADGNVGSTQLGTNAVTTIKITDANVTTAKIAENAVTSAKIADTTLASLNAYDIAFTAGFDKDMVKENVAVAIYGELVMARAGRIIGERGYIDTAPTGSPCIVRVEKNGVGCYGSGPGEHPTCAIGSNTFAAGSLIGDPGAGVPFAAGDRITFKVTQIGSSEPGEGLRFTLKCKLTE